MLVPPGQGMIFDPNSLLQRPAPAPKPTEW
jgi:hypothetical protein